MAANGAKHGGPPKAEKEGKPIKDETIAKAAGALVGVGIAWSLFRSVTGRGNKQQFVHTQEHVTKEGESKEKGFIANVEDVGKDIKEGLGDVGTEIKGTLVGGGKEVKGVENGELAGKEVKGSLEAAGWGHSQFGHKETQKAKLNGLHKKVGGQTIEVHSGDTLWGIARKYGVSVDSLVAVNKIGDGHSIVVGETLVLPK